VKSTTTETVCRLLAVGYWIATAVLIGWMVLKGLS